MLTFEDLKGEWVSSRSGKRVEVVSMRADSVGLRHESGRQSTKQIHYFIEEYLRPENHISRRKPTCSDCTVGRGYRPFLDFVQLCPRHANEWQPIETAPKDGTLILLSEGDYVTPGCWDCDSADEGGQCWRDRVYDADRITPTRRMPLPAAPALTETEATK